MSLNYVRTVQIVNHFCNYLYVDLKMLIVNYVLQLTHFEKMIKINWILKNLCLYEIGTVNPFDEDYDPDDSLAIFKKVWGFRFFESNSHFKRWIRGHSDTVDHNQLDFVLPPDAGIYVYCTRLKEIGKKNENYQLLIKLDDWCRTYSINSPLILIHSIKQRTKEEINKKQIKLI